MNFDNQKGFSIVEMVVVVVIIGIVSSIGIPLLKKAIYNAEEGNIFATTKIIAQEQLTYFSQNNRYARLDEINQIRNGGFGTTSGNTITRGKFKFRMSPDVPANSELTQDYIIIAERIIDGAAEPYQITVSADGHIVQLTP